MMQLYTVCSYSSPIVSCGGILSERVSSLSVKVYMTKNLASIQQ